MASTQSAQALADFQLSDAEALVVAATKLWLMENESERDPDEEDRIEKDLVCWEYALGLHRMCQQELKFDDVPEPQVSALIARMDADGWAPAIRRVLGDLDFDNARQLLTDRRLVESLLATVTRRSRAVLLVVELSAFYPWPKGIKFEKDERRRLLDDVARALPSMTVDYAHELDRELSHHVRKMALRNLNWKRIGLVAGTGAVLGVITGGLAATAIGGAIGASMGLSGAAAVNAGLALLGGGSLAAGGFGVAGGTLVVTGVAGVGAGAIGAGGAAWHGHPSAIVLVDMVKLDVLTEYMLIREQNRPQQARLVAVAIEQSLREGETRAAQIEEELGRGERLALSLAQMEDLVGATEAERDAAMAELEAARAERDALKDELKNLKQSQKYRRSGGAAVAAAVENYA